MRQWKKILVLGLFCALPSFGASASAPSPQVAFQKLKNCESDASACPAALEALEKFSRGNPHYVWAIAQSARVLYRLQRWNEFFGIVWVAKGEFSPARIAPILILEALANVRHCRFADAARDSQTVLAPKSGAAAASSAVWHEEADSLKELLPILAAVPWEKLTKSGDGKRKGDPRSWWPVGVNALRHLDPYRVHRRVSPLCGEGSAE